MSELRHFFEGTRWTPEQVQAFARLAEQHPGAPLKTDTLADPGKYGVIMVWLFEGHGSEPYLLHEDGALLREDGTEIRLEAVQS